MRHIYTKGNSIYIRIAFYTYVQGRTRFWSPFEFFQTKKSNFDNNSNCGQKSPYYPTKETFGHNPNFSQFLTKISNFDQKRFYDPIRFSLYKAFGWNVIYSTYSSIA